jgi:membrane-anchored protein YejM (alkaline phosphatase superfamily)
LEVELVPKRYRDSPWFRDRRDVGQVAATRAIVPSKPPIVLFFTIDALRADLLEHAEHRESLPELVRLRSVSSYFTRARSPTASTLTTMSTVFAGKYYSQMQWNRSNSKHPLIEPTPRFPELVSAAGIHTLLVAGSQGRLSGSYGVGVGFKKEVNVPRVKPATGNVDAIIAELEQIGDAPLFVYAHFIEPHMPYDLAGKKGTPFERYLREVALVDRQLKRLRRFLEERGLAERTYLIVTADHGEAFGEHGTTAHARTVYEEAVHVPFFFYLPGRQGQELDVLVSGIDVGPTVLDLFNLPAPGFWMGQSLLPVVAGTARKLERPLAIDTGRYVQALCFDDGRKVIFNRPQHTTEVFDLKQDPKELTNLAASDAPRIKEAIQIGEFFFSRIRRSADLPQMGD